MSLMSDAGLLYRQNASRVLSRILGKFYASNIAPG